MIYDSDIGTYDLSYFAKITVGDIIKTPMIHKHRHHIVVAKSNKILYTNSKLWFGVKQLGEKFYLMVYEPNGVNPDHLVSLTTN